MFILLRSSKKIFGIDFSFNFRLLKLFEFLKFWSIFGFFAFLNKKISPMPAPSHTKINVHPIAVLCRKAHNFTTAFAELKKYLKWIIRYIFGIHFGFLMCFVHYFKGWDRRRWDTFWFAGLCMCFEYFWLVCVLFWSNSIDCILIFLGI